MSRLTKPKQKREPSRLWQGVTSLLFAVNMTAAAEDAGSPAPTVGSSTEAATPLRMTNDAPFRHRLEQVWAACPRDLPYPEAWHSWLGYLGNAAHLARYEPLAVEACRESLHRWPHDGATLGNLACSLACEGKFEDALKAIDEAATTSRPNQIQLAGVRAECLWQLGRHEEAKECFSTMERPEQSDYQLQMWLACQAYYHADADHDLDACRKTIGELLGMPHTTHWRNQFRRDVTFDAYRQEAWFIDLMGKTAVGTPPTSSFTSPPPDAILDGWIRDFPRASPAVGQAQQDLTTAWEAFDADRWTDAVDAAKAGIETKEEVPELWVVLALAQAALDDASGSMSAIRDITDRGVDLTWDFVDFPKLRESSRTLLKRVIDEAGDAHGSRRRVALVAVILAVLDIGCFNRKSAKALLDRAWEWDSTVPEVLNTRAIAEHELGDDQAAEADLEQCLAMRPHYADAYFNLGVIRLAQARYEAALTNFDTAEQLGAQSGLMARSRADVFAKLGKLDAAIELAERLVEERPVPRHADGALWRVSTACLLAHRFTDSERLTRLVLKVNPLWNDAWIKLGGDLARQGRFEEAAAAVRTGLERGEEDSIDGRFALACCEWKLGKRDEAQAIATGIAEPKQGYDLKLYQTGRALFAAIRDDRDNLRDALRALFSMDHSAKVVEWATHEVFLDPFRHLDWFVELMQAQDESVHGQPH
jgi:tetratricopeptide (TPR) repeat protein